MSDLPVLLAGWKSAAQRATALQSPWEPTPFQGVQVAAWEALTEADVAAA
jgi:hypothetical protein